MGRMVVEAIDQHPRAQVSAALGSPTYEAGEDFGPVGTARRDDNNPDDAPHAGRVKSGLNHVGVVVDDLEATEQAVIAAGLEPFNHGNYEPGRRFYFLDGDGVEYEVVSYTPAES